MPITKEKAPAVLPDHAKDIFVGAWNSAYEGTCKGESERDACASKIAWSAVKNKYAKGEDGNWHAKSDILNEFSFVITKASIDKASGEMRWMAVASDTDEDSYKQRMSLELFNDFITRANSGAEAPVEFRSDYWKGGMPYLSVSHYEDFNGQGSAGETTNIYIDGNRLKAKGICYPTSLGKAAFKAIKESLDNPNPDNKVRISIGFLDWKHTHNGVLFDRKSIYDICPMCRKSRENVVFLRGQLIHLALTRVPVNTRTTIEAEVTKSMTTMKEDAESIVGEEEAEKLESLSRSMVGKSEVLVVKADEEVTTDPKADDEEQIVTGVVNGEEEVEVDDSLLMSKKSEVNEFDLTDEELEMFDALPEPTEPVVEEASARKDVSPADKKAAKKEYGNVKFADETNKKYPIDTEKHIRAAWSYINMPRNASKYSPEEVKSIKGKIISAWKKVIGGEPPSVQKGDMMGEDVQMMLPYDGACTFEEYDAWLTSQEQMSKAYDVWYTFNNLASNVLQRGDIEDKPKALAELLSGCKTRLETKSEAILERIEQKLSESTEMVQKSEVVAHPLDEAFAQMKSIFDDTVSKEIPESEKLMALQPALDNLGEVLRDSVKAQAVVSPDEPVPSATTGVDATQLKAIVEDVIAPIAEKVNILMQAQSAQAGRTVAPRQETVPQRRGLPAQSPLIAKPSTSETPNLHSIVLRSVGLGGTERL